MHFMQKWVPSIQKQKKCIFSGIHKTSAQKIFGFTQKRSNEKKRKTKKEKHKQHKNKINKTVTCNVILLLILHTNTPFFSISSMFIKFHSLTIIPH